MITKMQNLIPKLVFSVLITTIIVSTFSLSRFQTAKAGASDVVVTKKQSQVIREETTI